MTAQSWRDRVALGGVWLALITAIAASLFLLWWPDFYTTTVTETGDDGARRAFTQSASLIEEGGPQIIAVLLVPVALALIALGIVFMRDQWAWARWLLWGVTLVAWAFSLLGSFSVGLFYMPTAALLILAALALPSASLPAEEPTSAPAATWSRDRRSR
jgi:hypothetical protein